MKNTVESNKKGTDNDCYTLLCAVNCFFTKHRNACNIVMLILIGVYVNLGLPFRMKRKNYPTTYIEYMY